MGCLLSEWSLGRGKEGERAGERQSRQNFPRADEVVQVESSSDAEEG